MSHYATPTAQHIPVHSSPHIHLTKSSHVHHVLRRQSPHIDSHATHSTQAWRKLALLHHANSLCAIQAKVRDTTCNGQRQHAPLCTPPPMSVNSNQSNQSLCTPDAPTPRLPACTPEVVQAPPWRQPTTMNTQEVKEYLQGIGKAITCPQAHLDATNARHSAQHSGPSMGPWHTMNSSHLNTPIPPPCETLPRVNTCTPSPDLPMTFA